MKKNFENSLVIGLALTLGVAVTGFVACAVLLSFDAGHAMFSKNPSRSMEPTLLAGDYIASRRLNGSTRELRRAEFVPRARRPTG
jgi:signal peptidase I